MTAVSRKKMFERESLALARAIMETAREIARLETQVEGMKAANQRRGVELARRIGK